MGMPQPALRPRQALVVDWLRSLTARQATLFDLIDEIEQSLALDVSPASWPIGMRHNFLGTYDLFADALLMLEH
jgi:peptide chain release factor 3